MTATIEDTVATIDRLRTDKLDPDEGMAWMSIPGANGDTRIMWDPRNKDDAKFAEEQYDLAKKQGMTVYQVDPKDGSKGEVVNKFPKKAGKLIAVKQIVGG